MAGEKGKPLTRDDVLEAINQNGGTTENLDLSGRVFVKGIELKGFDLHSVILRGANLQEAELSKTNLEKAVLVGANLQKALLAGANLSKADLPLANLEAIKGGGVNFHNANLMGANLCGAVLPQANMEGAFFLSIRFSRDTDFFNVKWGSKLLIPPNVPMGVELPSGKTFGELPSGEIYAGLERTCRELKNWHNEAGMYDVAGHFFYWEMTARRKVFWWGDGMEAKKLLRAPFPRKPFQWTLSTVYNLLCGYGEKWWKVIISAIVVVLGLALTYFAIGTLAPDTFLNCLYYSAVSFTALGYGSWAPQPTGWVKGLGAFEAFVGVFMMALFLVTFIRKMTR